MGGASAPGRSGGISNGLGLVRSLAGSSDFGSAGSTYAAWTAGAALSWRLGPKGTVPFSRRQSSSFKATSSPPRKLGQSP